MPFPSRSLKNTTFALTIIHSRNTVFVLLSPWNVECKEQQSTRNSLVSEQLINDRPKKCVLHGRVTRETTPLVQRRAHHFVLNVIIYVFRRILFCSVICEITEMPYGLIQILIDYTMYTLRVCFLQWCGLEISAALLVLVSSESEPGHYVRQICAAVSPSLWEIFLCARHFGPSRESFFNRDGLFTRPHRAKLNDKTVQFRLFAVQQSDTHCTIQCTKYVRCAIVLFALSVLVLGSDLDPIAVFCPLQGFTPSINVLFGGTAPALSRLIGPRYPRVSPLHFLEMHPCFRRRAVKMFRLFTTGQSHESEGQPPCTRLRT